MDFSELFGFASDMVIQHWTFLVVSILLGGIGNFMKTRVWTRERAISGTPHWLWWWGRASLSLHAAAGGFMVGMLMKLAYGDGTPAGPGIETAGEHMLYYMGSGIVSSWVYSIIKTFLKARGIEEDPISMPGDSVSPPPLQE